MLSLKNVVKSEFSAENEKPKGCLSCGSTKNIKNRKYCSVKCRQNLRQKLNMRNGLLQALNTRYAAFYFSDKKIVLDIVPYGIKEIFRYESKRTTGNNPASDFGIMANTLGNAWWKESKRTNKNYLASQHVLKLATRLAISDGLQRPRLVRLPNIRTEALNFLEIKKTDLHSYELNKIIKSAYRRQVKIHHPDVGGQAATFRKIHNAYKEILSWADNPVYIRRRGFPDKWYYDGENDKWLQPMPARK